MNIIDIGQLYKEVIDYFGENNITYIDVKLNYGTEKDNFTVCNAFVKLSVEVEYIFRQNRTRSLQFNIVTPDDIDCIFDKIINSIKYVVKRNKPEIKYHCFGEFLWDLNLTMESFDMLHPHTQRQLLEDFNSFVARGEAEPYVRHIGKGVHENTCNLWDFTCQYSGIPYAERGIPYVEPYHSGISYAEPYHSDGVSSAEPQTCEQQEEQPYTSLWDRLTRRWR